MLILPRILLARFVDSRSDFLETTGHENGGNVIAYAHVLISFHSRDVPWTLSRSAGLSNVLSSFGCSLFSRLFDFLGV